MRVECGDDEASAPCAAVGTLRSAFAPFLRWRRDHLVPPGYSTHAEPQPAGNVCTTKYLFQPLSIMINHIVTLNDRCCAKVTAEAAEGRRRFPQGSGKRGSRLGVGEGIRNRFRPAQEVRCVCAASLDLRSRGRQVPAMTTLIPAFSNILVCWGVMSASVTTVSMSSRRQTTWPEGPLNFELSTRTMI